MVSTLASLAAEKAAEVAKINSMKGTVHDFVINIIHEGPEYFKSVFVNVRFFRHGCTNFRDDDIIYSEEWWDLKYFFK